MKTKNKSPPEPPRLFKSRVEDPCLRDLVYVMINDIDKYYKSDLEQKMNFYMVFKIGYKFGKYLSLYKQHYPLGEKEANKAESEVMHYLIFHK